MAGVLSSICAGLSAFFAGIAWLLQLLPIPAIGAARWFDRAAIHLKSTHQQ